MKANFLFLFLVSIMLSGCQKKHSDHIIGSKSKLPEREFYQLKVYTIKTEEQVAVTDKYLKEAFLPGIKKQGIKNIGVFKLRKKVTDTVQQIYVLIPFVSMQQFLRLEDELNLDKEYIAKGNEYIHASYQKPPYQRIESTLLKAFADMPMMKAAPLNGPKSERIYELRSYESATEQYYKSKVDMFNAGGEIKLFEHLGFNAVFYAEVISGSKMPNLVYMTTFTDMASRDAHWKSFVEDPAWKEMKALPKYQNTVSHADILLLTPTEYSDY